MDRNGFRQIATTTYRVTGQCRAATSCNGGRVRTDARSRGTA